MSNTENVASLADLAAELKKHQPYAFPFVMKDMMCPGMQLRDYFAAKAISPMLDTADVPVHGWAEYVAGGAYHIADAMLIERETPQAAVDPAREKMAQLLFAILDELGDGTGRTSADSFLPQTLVDRIEAVLSGRGAA